MPTLKLALIGECMAEITGQPLTSVKQNFGGDTMNTAIYMKQLMGQDSIISFVSVMGNDALSHAMIAKWQEYGIDTSLVLTDVTRHAGLYQISNDESGERHFQYWRSNSAAKFMMQHETIEQVFHQLTHYDAVFLSGISIAILPEQDQAKLIVRLNALKKSGLKVIFDSNYRPALWSSRATTQRVFNQLYCLADIILVTFEDEQLVWGDADIQACYRRLRQSAKGCIVIKDGANGCWCFNNDECINVPAAKVSKVVDTTAAGDSFNAGYLAGWLTGMPLFDSGMNGNRLAAQVIKKSGAIVSVDIDFM